LQTTTTTTTKKKRERRVFECDNGSSTALISCGRAVVLEYSIAKELACFGKKKKKKRNKG
jgi:hypothetical protein